MKNGVLNRHKPLELFQSKKHNIFSKSKSAEKQNNNKMIIEQKSRTVSRKKREAYKKSKTQSKNIKGYDKEEYVANTNYNEMYLKKIELNSTQLNSDIIENRIAKKFSKNKNIQFEKESHKNKSKTIKQAMSKSKILKANFSKKINKRINILKKLTKNSLVKTHVSTLEDLDRTNELIFKLNKTKTKTQSFLKDKCGCVLCLKFERRKNTLKVSIKSKFKQNKLDSEDVKKMRITNRKKQAINVLKRAKEISDPYKDRQVDHKRRQMSFDIQSKLNNQKTKKNLFKRSSTGLLKKPDLKIFTRTRRVKSKLFFYIISR